MVITTLLLICALGTSHADCSIDTAEAVIQGPDAMSLVECGLHGQAYLADGALAELPRRRALPQDQLHLGPAPAIASRADPDADRRPHLRRRATDQRPLMLLAQLREIGADRAPRWCRRRRPRPGRRSGHRSGCRRVGRIRTTTSSVKPNQKVRSVASIRPSAGRRRRSASPCRAPRRAPPRTPAPARGSTTSGLMSG